MIELIIFAVIAAIILFKINHPHITWRCMFGIHKYIYSHEVHGMHFDNKSNRIIGTKRRLYTCSCGKHKLAESKDWI